jgi:uncharacterized protein (TIGR02453 family)
MTAHFSESTFEFLRELARNNSREWFEANRSRYETHVKGAALRFIVDFAPRLARISPHFRADPRPVGGSLFRIYRDMRYSRDRRPYKTHLGIRFPHELARDVHAPGLYLHIAPGEVFVGCGIWHPDTATLRRLRDAIVDDPDRWVAARDDADFRGWFGLNGDRLKRAPRGFDPAHPLVEDLKRKDFTAGAELLPAAVTRADFIDEYTEISAAATPFMRWLCGALNVPF